MIGINHRDEIIKRIKTIEDKNVIDEIYRLMNIDFEESVFILNDSQKNEVAEAREEIKKGKGIPSSKANEEIDKWLKK